MNIDGKIAVITFASSGLGAARADALVAAGAVVYGLARNEEKLHDIENKLGKNFIPAGMDFTAPERNCVMGIRYFFKFSFFRYLYQQCRCRIFYKD